MSAFFVPDATIDAICSLLTMCEPVPVDQLTKLGRAMLHNNADAMEARYGPVTGSGNAEVMSEFEGYRVAADAYTFQPRSEPLPALYKQLRCYLYQCSEGQVDRTPLHLTLSKLADRLERFEAAPEYDAAPWGMEA